ncbi:MAG: hypothetical protein ACI4EF_01265 [Coprococcus sp.]
MELSSSGYIAITLSSICMKETSVMDSLSTVTITDMVDSPRVIEDSYVPGTYPVVTSLVTGLIWSFPSLFLSLNIIINIMMRIATRARKISV